MDGTLQSRINPFTSPSSADFSAAKVNTPAKAEDSLPDNRTSFKDLLYNSNEDAARARVAQKNGDGLQAAQTDEEFAKAMTAKINKDNQRKPMNELDKDSFLKLFVTQMQNQDPLNPDDSAEMAAQLAQFHGLEQMMNVNKNLEKMQTDESVGRAMNLITFVGQEVKVDGGRMALKNGKISHTSATLEQDVPKASMEVRNAAGVVVATRDLGMMKSGEYKMEWDGIDNAGKKAPDANYTVAIIAKDMNDQDIPAKLTTKVKVLGVDLKDGAGGSFYTELGKVRINEISSVGSTGFDGGEAEKPVEPMAGAKAAAAGGGPGQGGPGGVPGMGPGADVVGKAQAAAAAMAGGVVGEGMPTALAGQAASDGAMGRAPARQGEAGLADKAPAKPAKTPDTAAGAVGSAGPAASGASSAQAAASASKPDASAAPSTSSLSRPPVVSPNGGSNGPMPGGATSAAAKSPGKKTA